MQFKNKKRKGFTIVEILIVVVIIGILAALVVPRMIDATKTAKVNSALGQHRTVIGQINSIVATKPEINGTQMDGELATAFGTKFSGGKLTTENAETTVTYVAASGTNKAKFTIVTKGVGVTIPSDKGGPNVSDTITMP